MIRSEGYFYLGDKNDNTRHPNGTIMLMPTIIQNIMLLVEAEECGALFYNSKELESLRNTLKYMGHPQPSTEIITDN